jgi:kynurenine formamidase
MRIVDLTLTLGPDTPTYPGDPPPAHTPFATHEANGYQVNLIGCTSHSGTHIDAPRHLFPGGKTLSDYPIETFVSEGVVLDLRATVPGEITLEALAHRLQLWPVRPGEFVLLWTGALETSAEGLANPAWLSAEAAALLVDLRVGLVGIDGLSVDDGDEPETAGAHAFPIHRLLLSADVLIAECLCNLEALGPGRVSCVFLPAAIENADGAPTRAIAWRLDPTE